MGVSSPAPTIAPEYLALVLRGSDIRDQVELLGSFRNEDGTPLWGAHYTPIWKVSIKKLVELQIPVPDIEQQIAIVDQWRKMVAAHDQQRSQIRLERKQFWDNLTFGHRNAN